MFLLLVSYNYHLDLILRYYSQEMEMVRRYKNTDTLDSQVA
jgi:hypothetical protein